MKPAKKITLLIALIAVVAVTAVVLTACSNATVQGQLANILNFDHNYERFVYEVTDTVDGQEVKGIYTVTVKEYAKGSSVTLGEGFSISDVAAGILVSGDLSVAGTSFKTACYLNLISKSAYLVPSATYRLQTVGGVETLKMTGNYHGGTLSYNLTKNGVSSSGKVDAKSPFYDNNEFYQMLRGATTLSSNFSFGFNVPVIDKNETGVANLTARCNNTAKIKTDWTEGYTKGDDAIYKENGIECFEVSFSRTSNVNGASNKAYYSTSNVSVNGWNVIKPIIKIIETKKDGEKNATVVYELIEMSITEPTA